MRFGKCKSCKKNKFLTKHSLIGSHKPPYAYVCRICHDLIHGFGEPRISTQQKGNPKNTKGTDRRKNKWK